MKFYYQIGSKVKKLRFTVEKCFPLLSKGEKSQIRNTGKEQFIAVHQHAWF